jgi:hypothetical protein
MAPFTSALTTAAAAAAALLLAAAPPRAVAQTSPVNACAAAIPLTISVGEDLGGSFWGNTTAEVTLVPGGADPLWASFPAPCSTDTWTEPRVPMVAGASVAARAYALDFSGAPTAPGGRLRVAFSAVPGPSTVVELTSTTLYVGTGCPSSAASFACTKSSNDPSYSSNSLIVNDMPLGVMYVIMARNYAYSPPRAVQLSWQYLPPSATPSPSGTPSNSPTPSGTPSNSPSPSGTPSASRTASGTGTRTPNATPSPSSTPAANGADPAAAILVGVTLPGGSTEYATSGPAEAAVVAAVVSAAGVAPSAVTSTGYVSEVVTGASYTTVAAPARRRRLAALPPGVLPLWRYLLALNASGTGASGAAAALAAIAAVAASPSSAAFNASFGALVTSWSAGTGTPLATVSAGFTVDGAATPTPPPSSGGSSDTVALGVGLGVGLGVPALGVALAALAVWAQRRRAAQRESAAATPANDNTNVPPAAPPAPAPAAAAVV